MQLKGPLESIFIILWFEVLAVGSYKYIHWLIAAESKANFPTQSCYNIAKFLNQNGDIPYLVSTGLLGKAAVIHLWTIPHNPQSSLG